MSFNKIRERINLKLYGSKERVLKALRIVNLLVSISAIATLIYLYGFQHSTAEQDSLLHIIKASFIFYICQYVIRFLYDFHPKQFLQNTWIEGSIMLFLLIEGISYNFFDVLLIEEIFQRMGISSFTDVTTFFIQGYFFIVVFLELKRSSTLFPKIKLHPAVVFMMSFLFIILAGTGLLMLPEMSQPTIDLGFTDAFFMSTSSCCR